MLATRAYSPLLRYGSVGRQVRSVARGHKPLAAAAHHPSAASQPEFVFDKLAMSAFEGPFACIERTIRHAADLGIYLFLSQALAVEAMKKESAPSISLASWRRLDHNRSHVLRRAPRSEV